MKVLFQVVLCAVVATGAVGEDLWRLARRKAAVHRFSTLFTAQNVRDYLGDEEGLAEAIAWCKATGITKVYLETYRSKYQAERETLVRARDRFKREGFRVSGAVATTRIGKISTGWNLISCYTNQGTQREVRSIFEYAARIFDEIMIDDFWFTDCTCGECDGARKNRLVRIRTKTFPVASERWEDYRAELMVQLSRSHVIGAAKAVNPNVKLIIKYPQWYDRYQERGYDVVRETRDFDRIWVGTETRDRDKKNGRMEYGAYFLMRWLSGIGGRKTGGGWYDSLQTTARTYIEQARQTVLAGAKESVLFSYGSLRQNFGPEDLAALRPQLPELLKVAAEVRKRRATGIAAYKPPGSAPEDERVIFDYVGMLGFPLKPVHEFPVDSQALFLPIHAWTDAMLAGELKVYIETGRPVLVTDGLARRLSGKVTLDAENVRMLKPGGRPASLLEMPQPQLDELRTMILKPFGVTFKAPADVALYLFTDGSWVAENFNDRDLNLELNGNDIMVGAREWVYEFR